MPEAIRREVRKNITTVVNSDTLIGPDKFVALSYCIGLRNAEMEMKLASVFVENTKDRVKKLLLEANDGEYLNLDYFRLEFGKKVLESNSLLVEKPTARVFW